MALHAARALAWTALVGLYVFSPAVGLSALAAGFGFVAGRRAPAFARRSF
jgi:hypothetical protein